MFLGGVLFLNPTDLMQADFFFRRTSCYSVHLEFKADGDVKILYWSEIWNIAYVLL